MTTLFVLQNQDNRLLDKHGEWVDGQEVTALFRTALRDVAVNQMVEANAGDHHLRIRILECEADQRGLPVLDIDLPATVVQPVDPIPEAELESA